MKKLSITILANTDLTRELGLMCRKPLEKDECAFFDFKVGGRYSFWNKNVSFPISLIFCDNNFNIKQIEYLEGNQLKPVQSSCSDIRYVVESHRDIPKEWELKIGDKIEIKDFEVLFNDQNS